MKKIFVQNTFAEVFTIIALVAIFIGNIGYSYAEGDEGKACGTHKEKMFEKIDTNGDGVISLEEHSAKAERHFNKMDADGDGKVTKEEAKNHHTAMMENYKKHHEGMKSTY